jgi:hypothetical protein
LLFLPQTQKTNPIATTTGLGSIDFEISIISKILCILMFLIITFRKKIRIVTFVFFLELFGQEHKFGT